MSKSRQTGAQTITALKQMEAGRTAEDVACEYRIVRHGFFSAVARSSDSVP